MKKKYYLYYKIILTPEYTSDKLNDSVLEILKEYPPPKYLKKFLFIQQSLKEAHKGLVYYLPSNKPKLFWGKDYKGPTEEYPPNLSDLDIIEVTQNIKITLMDKKKEITKKEIMDIIEEYKVPMHLSPLFVIAQSLKDAHKGLVYFGDDSRGRRQYVYGRDFVSKRNASRKDIFIRVHRHMKDIEAYISRGLGVNKEINLTTGMNNVSVTLRTQVDEDFLMATLLLLELKTFIRTGRNKYDDENNTEGLLSLRTNSIKIENPIIIQFVGKKNVSQYFEIRHPILRLAIKNIHRHKNEYFFTTSDGDRLSETFFYSTLKKLGVTLKNIRTYGVNIMLLREIYNYSLQEPTLKNSTPTKFKSVVKSIMTKVASMIGHTAAVSKKSYVSDALLETLYNNYPKLLTSESFDEFFNRVIKLLS